MRRVARGAWRSMLLTAVACAAFAWIAATYATAATTVHLEQTGEGIRWKSLGSEAPTFEWGYKIAVSKEPKCAPDPPCRQAPQYFVVQRSIDDPQEFIPYAQNLNFTPEGGFVYIGVGELSSLNANPPSYSEELKVHVVGEVVPGDPAPTRLWTEGNSVLWEQEPLSNGEESNEWGYELTISDQPHCGTSCPHSEPIDIARTPKPQRYSPCLAELDFTPSNDTVYVVAGTIQSQGGTAPSRTGSEVELKVPRCPPPTITGSAPSSISEGAAALNATVNPNGHAVSDCHFDYGTSAAYGASVPCASLPPSGTSAVAVSAQLTGLSADTTYHFRIVATGVDSTSYGPDQTFATSGPPVLGITHLDELPPRPFAPPPANRVAPSIGGKAIAGYSVTPSPGAWEHTPTSYAYNWQLCDANGGACAAIDGTGGGPLELAGSDVGHRLRLSVVASNAAGSAVAISAPSPIIGAKVEAKFEWTFNRFAKYTIVEALHIAGIPPEGLVEVTCQGRGCPFALAHPAAGSNCQSRRCQPHPNPSASSLNVASIFKRRHLRPGTVITVRVTRAGWVGRSIVFTVLAKHDASHHSACLAPGSTQPGQGC
jgi:hypothetical protein